MNGTLINLLDYTKDFSALYGSQRHECNGNQNRFYQKIEFRITVKLGSKELLGRPKIVPYSQKFLKYPYEVNVNSVAYLARVLRVLQHP